MRRFPTRSSSARTTCSTRLRGARHVRPPPHERVAMEKNRPWVMLSSPATGRLSSPRRLLIPQLVVRHRTNESGWRRTAPGDAVVRGRRRRRRPGGLRSRTRSCGGGRTRRAPGGAGSSSFSICSRAPCTCPPRRRFSTAVSDARRMPTPSAPPAALAVLVGLGALWVDGALISRGLQHLAHGSSRISVGLCTSQNPRPQLRRVLAGVEDLLDERNYGDCPGLAEHPDLCAPSALGWLKTASASGGRRVAGAASSAAPALWRRRRPFW